MRNQILTHITNHFSTNQLIRKISLAFLLTGSSSPFIHAQCNAVPGEIKGTVYIDLNLNGISDAGDGTKSQAIIKVFTVNNQLVAQATTDANGNFQVSGLTNLKTYKLELQKPSGYEYASKGANDIKFITTPSCDIKFGIQDKSSACNPNTANVYTTCFVKSGGSPTAPTLVQLPFLFNSTSPMSKIAMQNQIGSVWGVAWNQSKQLLYSSAFVKSGTGLGSAGTTGIYVSNPKLGATNVFIDLKNVGIQAGNLSGIDPLDCSYSDYVGKAGLGDMDISDDDQFLYVTNLYNKSLVIIPTNQPTAANVMEIKIPDPGCNSGDYVVGAVEYHNNHLYIGVTCTAETTKNKDDFYFHIYEYDLLTRTFNIIFSTSFAKEFWLAHPQNERPISQWLTNIAFADDNYMVLGIADRTGHTYCDNVYPLTGQSGDILMLWKDNGIWKLENGGVAGSRIGSGTSHYEGPGHGEFFGDDFWTIGPGLHPENSLGSVAVLNGTQEVISTVFDPIYESFAGGMHKYSTLNGKKKSAIQLYNRDNSAYGKSSGLGDLAIACPPLPIEIGDYVWLDENENGIQDPDEKALTNIKISLFDSKCNLIGTTLTDATGHYIFNSTNVDLNQDGQKDELQPFETYYLLVNDPAFNQASGRMIISKDTFKITSKHALQGIELSDNNAVIYTSSNCSQFKGYPYIEIQTGGTGQNNYSFDIGFVKEKVIDIPPPPPPPPSVKKYDLALIKKVVGTGSVKSGDLVTFNITIYNQGVEAVNQFTVTDYVHDYFTFEANQNPGWILSGNKARFIQNAVLNAGQNVTIAIKLRLNQNAKANAIINTAEISEMRNETGALITDVDSTPDEIEDNDKGGVPNSITDNIIDNNAIDEDDHDRESLPIADLALINKTVNTLPVKLNETVTFEMEVFNQGNVTAGSFSLVNYIPAGFKFEPSLNPAWTLNGNNATIKITDAIQPGSSKKIPIRLILKSQNLTNLIDVAEITAFWDVNNNLLKDFDSTPDNNPTNDKGGQLYTATDNVINDDGTIDEDDQDPASIDIFDLALILTTDQVNPVKKNQDVLFHITVCNQGNIPAQNTGVVEYLPEGLTISPFDNHGWFLLGGVYRNTISSVIAPNQCATIDFLARVKPEATINNLLNRAEITQAFDTNLRDLSTRDFDSNPDYIIDNDPGGVVNTSTDNIFTGNGIIDEDDADPAALTIMDLALIKKYTSPGSLKYKGTCSFNIQVFNQGNTTVGNVEVTDYLPAGFTLAQSAVIQGWVLSNGKASITLNGSILPGSSSSVDITLQNTSDVLAASLINVAEISKVYDTNNADISAYDFDSTPDKNPSNDAGGVVNSITDNAISLDPAVDEDDADPAGIPVFDLALRKTLSVKKSSYWKGDTIDFKIEIFNQGNVIAKDIEITDYLDSRYVFSAAINPGWSLIQVNQVNFHPGITLAPGASYSTLIHVIIGDISTAETIPNYAEISKAHDNVGNDAKDFDSTFDSLNTNDKGGTPGSVTDNEINDHGDIDEDDHDGAESSPKNFDLALIKDIDHLIVTRDELLNFEILIVNQGLVTATEIEVVDYLPEGLILEDPDWVKGSTSNGITTAFHLMNEVNGRLPQGGLKPKDTLRIYIKTRVDPAQVAGVIVNRAEISHALNKDLIVDEDSSPDTDFLNDAGGVVFENSDGSSANFDLAGIDDEDDEDPAGIIIVDLERSIACQCLDNATNSSNGQFLDELSFRSVSGDRWFIFDVDGLYDPSSAAPPAAPTPFVTGPGGFTLYESPLGDGTSVYFIQGIHVEGIGYSIILSNQNGVKLNSGVNKCFYEDPVLLKAQNNVCSGQTVRYEVKKVPNASYSWTLSGGGTILTNPSSNAVDVIWTGNVGSTYTLTIDVDLPGACYNPIELPVTIGSSSGPVSCIGSLQVSLDKNCEATVTPQMVLIGGPYDYTSYAVMIKNKDGSLVPNNKLYYEHVGKELTATVINVCSGNSCWVNITVEDKVKPKIKCVNDTIDCTLMKSYIIPFISDNCDPNPTRILNDEIIVNTPCDLLYSKIVTRTYTVKDKSGNISLPCQMNIYLKRIQLDSIVFPDSLTREKLNPLICSRFATDSIGHPLPSVTGIPTYRGALAWPNTDNKYCDYTASYEDIEFPNGKDCVKKILRNWKFTIWFCNYFEQRTYPQLIEIVDTTAPTITCPYDITATTNSFTCNANVWIPMPKVFDSCGQVLRVDLSYPGGFIHDFRGQYVSLPVDNNALTFTAYDLCYNHSECSFEVNVYDRTPPVAICDQQTVVTLDRFGEAWVAANVFDDGSYDDCHLKYMQVRRMTSPNVPCGYTDQFFHDSVQFCCQDIGKEIMVMFKVVDAHGNENTCMVRVEVQDKTIPHISCPHDVTIECDYHYNLNDLSEFGKPIVSDNCNVDFREVVDPQINQCREGYIDRIFIAGNSFGEDVCVQRITVINSHPFAEKDIIWPYDFDTTTCDANGLLPETLRDTFGYPILHEDFCDLVGVSYEDNIFHFINGSDACYKIIRTWKVINWCRYNVVGPFIPVDQAVWTHQQILKIHNTVAPKFTSGCRDTVFNIIDTTCNGGNAYLVATYTDDCTPVNEMAWEYHIDLNSDHIEDISRYGVGPKIDASGFYPLGKHTIKYVCEDKCGNKTVCERTFEIVNKKAPTAYCIAGLAVSLVPMDLNGNGSVDAELVTIWATDFDRGSYHPCGYPLTFSLGRDTSVKSVTYDCDSIGRRMVTLCVTASNGTQDCCNTFIDVQDNNNVDLCNCVKFPPNLTITDCSQNTDPVVIHSEPTVGNCTNCTPNGIFHKDSIVKNIPNTCFVVYRTWTVKFICAGEPDKTFDRTQIITVTTDLQNSDIQWPSDSVIVDNCSGSIDTSIIGEVPRFCVNGGNIMLMYSDKEIRREQTCIFYERTWTVASKCAPSQSYSFRQVLKVLEAAGVRYIVPGDITVTDCKKILAPDSLNGYPKTNCLCDKFTHSFKDSVVNNIPNTCKVVYRKWTSTFNCPPDVSGTFKGTQIITMRVNLTLSDIEWPSDSIHVDNCRGSVDTLLIGGIPKLKKDFCGFVSIHFSDQIISQNDTCKLIHRTWVVANDCSTAPNKQQFTFVQTLKVTKPNGPQVDFPDDITVTDCKKPLLPDSLNGFPKLNCPCNSFTHTFTDSLVLNIPNTCYVVYRKWTSTYNCPPEVSGTFKGTQVITIRINLNPNDIKWPSDSVVVTNCAGSVDTGLIDNIPKLMKDYCGYVSFHFTDQTILSNDTCKVIHRTWVASNDCTSGQNKQQFTFVQALKVTNPKGPRVTFPSDLTITDCKKPFLPDSLNGFPKANCTACDSIKFTFKDDTLGSTNGEVCYIVERNWSARFICKPKYDTTIFHVQKITRDVDLNPADITWPKDTFTSVTCIPTLDPKFSGQPTLKKDYCGFVTFSFKDTIVAGGECKTIKRTWTANNSCSLSQHPKFNQYIITKNQDPPSITCPKDTILNADPNTCGKAFQLNNPKLNNSCNTFVTFTNNAPSVFPVGMTFVVFTAKDSCNHTATCTVKVTVLENTPPKIVCPHDTLLLCSANTDTLSKFGLPIVTDNCPGVTYKETAIRNQDVCGVGTIMRKFVAKDASGNSDSCTQLITIINPDPIQESDIHWPDSPISTFECDDVNDTTGTGSPEFDYRGFTCAKLAVTFSDSNECKQSGNCVIDRKWTVFDSCSGQTFMFTQSIWRTDTIAPHILGVHDTTQVSNDSTCNNFVVMKAFVDNCDSATIIITNDSPYGANDFEDASGFYPPGVTFVTFKAVDYCCNESVKTIKITIIDTIAPEFTCIKVVKKIKDNGCASFNANDFIAKKKDNCTDSTLIMASFNLNNFNDTLRVICCDSIRNFEYTTSVKVYFKDIAGNIDSCSTFLQAVDQDTICGPTFTSIVKGLVSSRKRTNMPGVEVMLNEGLSGMVVTNRDGSYRFPEMPNGGRYVVKPQHDINPVNGVSTADIIHIQRHILGIAPFTDPLKFIAADVNNNRKVTAADIVDIRKLILGKTDHFAKSPSWKFILSNYQFADKQDPLNENWPEYYTIPAIQKNYYLDFTGIKMGDVDDSNDATQFSNKSESRNAGSILLVSRNQVLSKEQIYEVELDLSQFSELDGMQFGLHVDPSRATLLGVVMDEDSRIKEDMFYLVPDKNTIRLSYVKSTADGNQWKVKLKIRMIKTAELSEVLEMSKDGFDSEAYYRNGDVASIKLDFVDQFSEQEGLSLYQNIPNPFNHTSIIPFQTAENAEITMRIINMNGKVVYENKKFYTKGYHEFEISKSQLDRSGIYYYQLTTDKNSLFRRMILID
jgi:uncharacterized repeat protein (TIGR01451 family)